jgi:hypothetical protein
MRSSLPGLFGILLLLKSWLSPIEDVYHPHVHTRSVIVRAGSDVVCFPAPPGQSGNECKLRAENGASACIRVGLAHIYPAAVSPPSKLSTSPVM